jgi:hypothetical protein
MTMKRFMIPVLGVALAAASAQAGTLMISNSKGFDSTPVVAASGMALTGLDPVVVAVGTFASEPASAISPPGLTLGGGQYAALLAEFTPFGPLKSLVQPVAPLNLMGVFDFQHEAPVGGTPLAGKAIYVIVAKGPDLANATEVCILKTNAMFDGAEDDNALPKRVSVGTAHGTTVIAGSSALHSAAATNLDPTLQAAYTMATLVSAPEIVVETSGGAPLPDGSSLGFGVARAGTIVETTCVIRNTGGGDLQLTGTPRVTISGPAASEFSVPTALPATIPPGGSSSFAIRFAPGSSGLKEAVLSVANNDTDEHPCDLALSGQAFSIATDLDGDGLNDWAEHQYAALGFDWQLAQTERVASLFSGANAAGLYTPAQVQALHLSTPLISRNPNTGKFKLTMDWKKSTNLADFFDFPAPANSVSINPQGDIEMEFTSPDDAAFFRVEAR